MKMFIGKYFPHIIMPVILKCVKICCITVNVSENVINR